MNNKFLSATSVIAFITILTCPLSSPPIFAMNDDHNHTHDTKEELQSNPAIKQSQKRTINEAEHNESVNFSPEQMALANIKVQTLVPQSFNQSVYAPGEIKANGYNSYIVSARTESVIIARHATLGEHVEQGQPLVTLFSESMAEAQANYRVNFNEWQRVEKLGEDTISASRLLSAETDYIASLGRLKAYGLTKTAIQDIVKNNSSTLGQYTLVAQRHGAVLADDFAQGQRVAAGDSIMVLADEQELWVEARISPNKALNLPIGTKASISLANQSYPAKVIQEAHTIDPITRTRIIRLAVKNRDDRLHPGMFVDVKFQFVTEQAVIAVPETALMRNTYGDWTVFVEDHPGEFKAIEVELGKYLGEFRQIIGLPSNSKVVTKGAFFVASEIAKGGFDPHNH